MDSSRGRSDGIQIAIDDDRAGRHGLFICVCRWSLPYREDHAANASAVRISSQSQGVALGYPVLAFQAKEQAADAIRRLVMVGYQGFHHNGTPSPLSAVPTGRKKDEPAYRYALPFRPRIHATDEQDHDSLLAVTNDYWSRVRGSMFGRLATRTAMMAITCAPWIRSSGRAYQACHSASDA